MTKCLSLVKYFSSQESEEEVLCAGVHCHYTNITMKCSHTDMASDQVELVTRTCDLCDHQGEGCHHSTTDLCHDDPLPRPWYKYCSLSSQVKSDTALNNTNNIFILVTDDGPIIRLGTATIR